MPHVAHRTVKFWDRHSVLTSVVTFSGNAINTIISPRGPKVKGVRKE